MNFKVYYTINGNKFVTETESETKTEAVKKIKKNKCRIGDEFSLVKCEIIKGLNYNDEAVEWLKNFIGMK